MSLRLIRPAARTLLNARSSIPARMVAVAPRVAAPAFRSFSISQRRLGNGESDAVLSAAISAEHAYEVQETNAQPEIPEFLDTFRSNRTWEIQDNPGADDVVLTRKFGSESLKLTFQISDIDPLAEEEDPDHVSAPVTDEGAEDVSAEDTPPYITVSLVISKPAHPNAMSVDMEAGEEGMVITNVAMFERGVALAEGNEGDWVRGGRYMGPQFEHLDTGVQDSFQAYLAERGVDDALAQFILQYAEYKEQRDYVSWLEQVKGFVDQ